MIFHLIYFSRSPGGKVKIEFDFQEWYNLEQWIQEHLQLVRPSSFKDYEKICL